MTVCAREWMKRVGMMGAALCVAAVATAAAECQTPVERGRRGWPRNATVFYDLERLPRDLRDQARAAFDIWTRANRRNGAGVQFREGRGPLAIVVRQGDAGSAPADARYQVSSTGETIGTATIRIDLDDRRIFNPDQPGFDTAVVKTVLHEVGHTMGLAHMRGSPCSGNRGRTIMNGLCGTNDVANAQPLDLSDCDRAAISSLYPSSRRRTDLDAHRR